MRQLWQEGWMPRRLRLLSAACLVEGLGLEWRLGRHWFEYTLIDHDPAINELMWQNAGLCGVDPYYRGIEWEADPTNDGEVQYVKYWMEKQLIWPPVLKTYLSRSHPLEIVEGAKSKRDALRKRGVYKSAKTVSNSGVRVSWPGLGKCKVIKEGEVMGVGVTPINELSI